MDFYEFYGLGFMKFMSFLPSHRYFRETALFLLPSVFDGGAQLFGFKIYFPPFANSRTPKQFLQLTAFLLEGLLQSDVICCVCVTTLNRNILKFNPPEIAY